jgi:hypothetical protein
MGGALLFLWAACATTNPEMVQEFNGRQIAPETLRKVERGQILKIEEVVACSRAGVPDSALAGQIRDSRAVYKLTPDEVDYLRNSGMSAELIEYMMSTVETVEERGPSQKAYGGANSDGGNVNGGLGVGFGF